MISSRERALWIGVLVGFVMGAGLLVLPRGSWAPPLIKMGVVKWEQVILHYEGYQNKLRDLEDRRERVLKFINREYKNLDRIRDQEIKRMYEDALKQIRNRREQTMKKYRERIREAIEQEAIEQGYSLILSESEVLYASEEYTDLTPDVIERLNESESP